MEKFEISKEEYEKRTGDNTFFMVRLSVLDWVMGHSTPNQPDLVARPSAIFFIFFPQNLGHK